MHAFAVLSHISHLMTAAFQTADVNDGRLIISTATVGDCCKRVSAQFGAASIKIHLNIHLERKRT